MKNIYFLIALFLIGFQLNADPIHDTVSMGQAYANDVFYSLDSGIVKIESRANWDIAFYTNRWSAGIQINDGAGVQLFTYPLGDSSAWNNMDVSQIENWKPMVNSDTIWEEGAFGRNALGHPDYGWGVYNAISHNVDGDSLFVVKLANGSLKKLFIKRKNSVLNTFYFKYADIDGSNEINETLDITPYQDSRLFLYYSLTMGMAVDREPDINSWDLVFNRYSAIVYDNEGQPSDYVVVGIACNNNVGVAKYHPVSPSFTDWTAREFEFYRTPIGHSWKEFNMSQFSYAIEDSLVFFIQNRNGNIYKFYPDYFSGTATGSTGFVKELLSLARISDHKLEGNMLTISPNPTAGLLRLHLNADQFRKAEVRVFDTKGKLVHTTLLNNAAQNLDLGSLRNGLYLIEVAESGRTFRAKVLLQH